MQKPLHLLFKDRPLDTVKHCFAFVENEASEGREEEDHCEHTVCVVTSIHEVYLLLAVLLDLLFGEL